MTNQIIWPKGKKDRELAYSSFLFNLFDFLKIDFSSLIIEYSQYELENPYALLKSYINGEVTKEVYVLAKNPWWDFIDDKGVTEINTLEAVYARLAIILLSVADEAKMDDSHMDQCLGWIFELMNILSRIDSKYSYPQLQSHITDYFR